MLSAPAGAKRISVSKGGGSVDAAATQGRVLLDAGQFLGDVEPPAGDLDDVMHDGAHFTAVSRHVLVGRHVSWRTG
ncbi:hypothetical protein MLGJGCBP_09355 [Rhodococcus sp. T7]|nr:hypothetical protein MLGJGCBP_09355 [Rhodococcus sp. T7]